ncbi:MAG TPA: dihydrofolate reductase family protein, partial [Arenicellales bacterium]|nr:dihydrofolate reductase family protein [Arenicellales bacterium]
GADVAGSFLSRNLVDELIVYMAPDVLGSDGRGMFIMPEIRRITDRHSFKIDDVRQFGRDLRIVFQNTSKT